MGCRNHPTIPRRRLPRDQFDSSNRNLKRLTSPLLCIRLWIGVVGSQRYKGATPFCYSKIVSRIRRLIRLQNKAMRNMCVSAKFVSRVLNRGSCRSYLTGLQYGQTGIFNHRATSSNFLRLCLAKVSSHVSLSDDGHLVSSSLRSKRSRLERFFVLLQMRRTHDSADDFLFVNNVNRQIAHDQQYIFLSSYWPHAEQGTANLPPTGRCRYLFDLQDHRLKRGFQNAFLHRN